MAIGLHELDPMKRLTEQADYLFRGFREFHNEAIDEHRPTPFEALTSIFGFGIPSIIQVGREASENDSSGVYAHLTRGLIGVGQLYSLMRMINAYESFRRILELRKAPWRAGFKAEKVRWRDFRYGVSLVMSRLTSIALIPMFIYWDYESGQEDPDMYRRQDFSRRTN